jgi:hypothetical protein
MEGARLINRVFFLSERDSIYPQVLQAYFVLFLNTHQDRYDD